MTRPYHYRYIDIAEEKGRDLMYFCPIRNPWARTVSRFNFGKQNASRWRSGDPRKSYITKATFEDFVKDQKVFEIPKHPGQPWMGPLSSWFNQLEWIRDENEKVACDCLRLECLSEDMSDYFGENIILPYKNVTKIEYDYRKMYTDELAEIIANTFAEDIEYFGFSFDGAATKNIYNL